MEVGSCGWLNGLGSCRSRSFFLLSGRESSEITRRVNIESEIDRGELRRCGRCVRSFKSRCYYIRIQCLFLFDQFRSQFHVPKRFYFYFLIRTISIADSNVL